MTDIQLHSLLMEITNPTLEMTLLDIFLLPCIAFTILAIAGLFSSPKVKHSLATLALATFPIYFAFYFLSDFRKSEHIRSNTSISAEEAKIIYDRLSYDTKLSEQFKDCIQKRQRDSIEIFYCVAEGGKILDSRKGTTWEAQIADEKIKKAFSEPPKINHTEKRVEPLTKEELKGLNEFKIKVYDEYLWHENRIKMHEFRQKFN